MTRIAALVALGLPLAGCNPCVGQGQNGVEDPDADEYQLLFSNIVSWETELIVDNLDDDADPFSTLLCGETEYITVGNFPVSTATTIEIHPAVADHSCYVSPCCSSSCDGQQCGGSSVVDTTPFAGRVFGTGLVWRF